VGWDSLREDPLLAAQAMLNWATGNLGVAFGPLTWILLSPKLCALHHTFQDSRAKVKIKPSKQ